MNAVETVKLTKKYKDLTAVDGLDLEIKKVSFSLFWASTAREKQPR